MEAAFSHRPINHYDVPTDLGHAMDDPLPPLQMGFHKMHNREREREREREKTHIDHSLKGSMFALFGVSFFFGGGRGDQYTMGKPDLSSANFVEPI